MADIKISNLPPATALAGTEPIPVVQGGLTVRTTPAALKTYIAHPGDHAEIYIFDGAYTQSVPNGSTPQLVAGFAQSGGANGEASGAVPVAASNKITVASAGRYLVVYSLSYTCGTNNVTWEAYVHVGGTRKTDTGAQSKLATGADVQCISGNGILALTAGQDIDLRVYHNYGSAVNLVVGHGNLTLVQISE